MAGRSGLVAAALAAADLGLSTLYPVFASYRAITSGDGDEQKRWLLVWLALAAVKAVDGAAGKLASFIPMRAELRIILFLWIMLPQTRVSLSVAVVANHAKGCERTNACICHTVHDCSQGAENLFDTLMLPVLRRNEGRIASAVAGVEALLGKFASSASAAAADAVTSHSTHVLSGAASALSAARAVAASAKADAGRGNDASTSDDERESKECER